SDLEGRRGRGGGLHQRRRGLHADQGRADGRGVGRRAEVHVPAAVNLGWIKCSTPRSLAAAFFIGYRGSWRVMTRTLRRPEGSGRMRSIARRTARTARPRRSTTPKTRAAGMIRTPRMASITTAAAMAAALMANGASAPMRRAPTVATLNRTPACGSVGNCWPRVSAAGHPPADEGGEAGARGRGHRGGRDGDDVIDELVLGAIVGQAVEAGLEGAVPDRAEEFGDPRQDAVVKRAAVRGAGAEVALDEVQARGVAVVVVDDLPDRDLEGGGEVVIDA